MITTRPSKLDHNEDGWIIDAGVCDDDGIGPTPTPPTRRGPGTTPPTQRGNSVIGSLNRPNINPIVKGQIPLVMVHCHDNDRVRPFDSTTVEGIIAEFDEANVTCALIEPIFRIDCLAAKYEEIALTLDNTGDQGIVKSA